MKVKLGLLWLLPVVLSANLVHADSLLSWGSAFSLVALGDSKTNTQGNITDSVDQTGRLAAANDISLSATIGSYFQATNPANPDPFGADAKGYALYAGNTISGQYNINGGGGAFEDSSSGNASFNWNDHGSLTTSSTISPLSFSDLSNTLDNLDTNLTKLTANGIVCSTSGIGNASVCSSMYPHLSQAQNSILYGTSKTQDVFDISADLFNSGKYDIEVPTGSNPTIVINVICPTSTPCSADLGSSGGGHPTYNGQQLGNSSPQAANILYNFPTASYVGLSSELVGTVLAPYATLGGGSDLIGSAMVASVGQTGEVEYVPFTGNVTFPSSPTPHIAVTPEPGTLILLGSGLSVLGLGVLRRRARQSLL